MMPASALPNSAAERFLAEVGRLPPLLPGSALGIAVSGGPDSLALAHLAASNLPHIRLSLAVVDHGLRADSAAEARRVAERLGGFCEDVTVLRWSPPEPVVSRKLEQARNARFALLGQWAADRGLLRVWLGHHADDQDETQAMRRDRGSGSEGAGGMARRRIMAQTVFERPLLAWRKAALISYCQANRLDFVEDPTNVDRRTARGRLRQPQPQQPQQQPPPPLPPQEQRARAGTLPDLTRRVETAGAVADPLGHLWWNSQRQPLTPTALQQAVGWVRGGDYTPDQARAKAALDRLQTAARVSLYGCVIEWRAGGWMLLCREARQQRLAPPKRDALGQWRLDDRWQVDGPGGDWGLVRSAPMDADTSAVPARVLSCLPTWNGQVPVIRDGGLYWSGNAARFSPRRPVFDFREN